MGKIELAFACTELIVYQRIIARVVKKKKKGQDQGGDDSVGNEDLFSSWKDKEDIPREVTLKGRFEEDLGGGLPQRILFAHRASLL